MKTLTMKTLKRPLVVVSALITVTLLLSWKYFDDGSQSIVSATSFSENKELTDEDLLTFLTEDGADPSEFEGTPAAEDVLVQRIPGDNNHMLMMAYYSKENYSGPAFTINNGTTLTFRDDGKGDDQKAGDGLYTAKIVADVQAFRKQAITMNHQMKASGYKSTRYLHRELVLDPDAVEGFDLQQFDSHHPTSVSGMTDALSDDLIDSSTASFAPFGTTGARNATVSATAALATTPAATKPTLLDSIRQNCMLITNLGVVEDPKRTWNYCKQSGNFNGPWTFNTLMRQLASKTPGQIATNKQVSDFVKNWLSNWDSTLVINGDTVNARTLIDSRIINPWLTKSKNAGAANGVLNMRFAPFKLIAIVNRFDLRDGQRFGTKGKPCGEARFVFSLVNSDCTGSLPMTVIFEYGINQPNTCESQHAWAQQWVNLKNFPLGSSQYNRALQSITDQFTLCGTNKSRPNQSSLDQLRTNEVTLASTPKTWEFREFILDDATGNLKETTVGQTPADKYNAQVVNDDVQRTAAYVNNHKGGIKGEKNVVPLIFQGRPFLAGSSRIKGTPTGNPPNVYYWDGTGASSAATFIADNDARFSFSLATCSGCHGGETQTHFTHIDTAFFGKEAGLSGFLTGKAGDGGAIDFDNDPNNDLFTVKDAALRPSASTATLRTFNDIKARARGLKNFVSSTCGSVLGISSQLMFETVNMVD